MLEVKNNAIYLTRGDSAQLHVEITNDLGEIYELEDGDICEFTLKKSTSNNTVLLKKKIINSELKITPDDTRNLKYGEYWYDVQVTLANGDVSTVISPSLFVVLEEVNFE